MLQYIEMKLRAISADNLCILSASLIKCQKINGIKKEANDGLFFSIGSIFRNTDTVDRFR